MRIFIFLLLIISGCNSTNNVQTKNSLSDDTKNAIALCSSQYSDEQKEYLEADYNKYKANLALGSNNSSKGLVIDQNNMNSDDKLELFKSYIQCINSHEVKKK